MNPSSPINSRVFDEFRRSVGGVRLPDRVRSLFSKQAEAWPRLADSLRSLSDVQVRRINCGAYHVLAQFNPGRIVSTGARVDPETIRNRSCFLCLEHLPPEQQGILYEDRFLLLCNPAPIFHNHLTIAEVHHQPQLLLNDVDNFLTLAQDLSPDFVVFYNGPRCGASAPDHLHFQASPGSGIPILGDALRRTKTISIKKQNTIEYLTWYHVDRAVLVLRGSHLEEVSSGLTELLLRAQRLSNDPEEPMINSIAAYVDGRWTVVVFFRARHRPSVFDASPPDHVLISPAAVDMGGLLITPREIDYQRVDSPLVKQIYREVSMPSEFIVALVEDN